MAGIHNKTSSKYQPRGRKTMTAIPSKMPWGRWRNRTRSDHFFSFTETYGTVTEGSLIGKKVKLHGSQRSTEQRDAQGQP